MEKCIGVLGARGTVGKTIVQYLKKRYRVLEAGRSIKPQNENEFQVDINDEQSLKKFCSACDVVINAIGPSYEQSERIISIVNSCNKPCVELFGGPSLERKLQDHQVFNVIGAGCVPGLSGIVLAYLAKEYEEGDKLSLVHGGLEIGGLAALKDIILSSLDGYGLPNKIIENGSITDQIKFADIKENIEGFLNSVYKDAFLDQEGIKVHDIYGINNLEQYHCYVDLKSKKLISDGCMRFASTDDLNEKNQICKEILDEQAAILGNNSSWFSINAVLQKKDKSHKILIRGKDSSFISGMVAAIAGEKLLCSEQVKKNTVWALEYLEPESVLSILRDNGVQIVESTKTNEQVLECGEI